MANLHPLTMVVPYRVNVNDLSKFLQMRRWLLCPNQGRRCRKRNLVHRPDIAVIYEEPHTTRPQNQYPYLVPIFIFKIEGAKDIWGSGEQESKALEEACATLAFMPDMFLLFIYHNQFEFWYLERNPADGSIDVTSHPIYVQHSGEMPFCTSMQKVLANIIGILVQQLVRNGNIIWMSIVEYHNANLEAYHDPRPGQGAYACPNCWVLPHPLSASNHCMQFINNPPMLPQFE